MYEQFLRGYRRPRVTLGLSKKKVDKIKGVTGNLPVSTPSLPHQNKTDDSSVLWFTHALLYPLDRYWSTRTGTYSQRFLTFPYWGNCYTEQSMPTPDHKQNERPHSSSCRDIFCGGRCQGCYWRQEHRNSSGDKQSCSDFEPKREQVTIRAKCTREAGDTTSFEIEDFSRMRTSSNKETLKAKQR